jgi:hypothetical protein
MVSGDGPDTPVAFCIGTIGALGMLAAVEEDGGLRLLPVVSRDRGRRAIRLVVDGLQEYLRSPKPPGTLAPPDLPRRPTDRFVRPKV